MKFPGWLSPWRKHTDQNTVTPIRAPLSISSAFGFIVEAFSGAWQSGLVLNNRDAVLANSAVYACVSLIAGDIAKLGVTLKERADRIWVDADVPVYSNVLRTPNRYETSPQFWTHWILSKLIWGNTYVYKSRDERGVVDGLYILDPQRCMPLVAQDGEVFYQIGADNLIGQNAPVTVLAKEIIHDRGPCLFHPLVGVPPLYAAALSSTQANRIQLSSSKFFQNMSRPSGHLTTEGKIDSETAARIKEESERAISGENLGRLLVTGGGLKWEQFTMPAEQAQLIEQLGWTVEDVARPFHMPLYKIAAGQAPAFTNPAVLNLEYYQQALQPHIEDAEALLNAGLALDPRKYKCEFDIDGLLRMDPKTRAEADEIAVRSGVMTPNEARAARSLPKVTGGDTCYLQQQNFSLAALAKRDAKDDPFKTENAAPAAAPAPKTPDAANDPEVPDDEAAASKAAFTKALAA